MANISRNLFYTIFIRQLHLTSLLSPPPHLDPRGPITFELVIMWGLVPILAIRLNATQHK